MKSLIVIPTYNEAENIERLIYAIFNEKVSDLDVLVVDDNSPDGTADIVRRIAHKNKHVFMLNRKEKSGLGTAYVAGFKYAIANNYELILEMDADFSHDPKDVKRLIEKAGECDLVIGSRYLQGVNVVNWPLSRLVLSVGANTYTRIITGMKIRDCTSGFKCFHRRVLEAIDLDEVHSDGYSFQIELSFKARRYGFSLCEIPIVFIDRVSGSSKMSKKIVREAMWIVWKLRILQLLGKL